METISRLNTRTTVTLADAWAALHAVHVAARGLPLSAVQAHELLNAVDRTWSVITAVEQASSDTTERIRIAREACRWTLATVMMPLLLDLVDVQSDGFHRTTAGTLVRRVEVRLDSWAAAFGDGFPSTAA